MSATSIAPEKIAAYRATEYGFSHEAGAIRFRIGTYCSDLQTFLTLAGFAGGALITAYNPLGAMHSVFENDAGQRALEADLAEAGATVFAGYGSDPEGRWPSEPSAFAAGIGRDVGGVLGRKYRQDAIVWVGTDAVPELVLLR